MTIAMILTAAMLAAVVLIYRYLRFMLEKRMAQYQNDLIRRHCDEVENMYRQTRGWRHDLKTHIQTMKAHLALAEYDRLEEYLNELDADLETVDRIVKTGNVMIDALLNSKLSLAASRGIRVETKALVPAKISIAEADLSVIIGNLMDNAIESCLEIPEEEKRFLRVYIDVLKGQLYIYVINSVEGNRKKTGKIYQTTKNSRDHGFGLLRMDRVVEKYDGYVDRQNEEGVFATEILLPL